MKLAGILTISSLMAAATIAMAADDGKALTDKDVLNLYKKNCASCHGMDGKGNTRMGRMSKVKDYTDAEYVKTIKEDEAVKTLLKGINEDGKWRMKPFKGKMTEKEILATVKYIKTFAKKDK